MTTKEKIAVMQHYEDGGKIMLKKDVSNEWAIMEKEKDGELTWRWNYGKFPNYSIYEEPKKKEVVTIEKWLCRNNGYFIVQGDKEYLENTYPLSKVKTIDTYEVEL